MCSACDSYRLKQNIPTPKALYQFSVRIIIDFIFIKIKSNFKTVFRLKAEGGFTLDLITDWGVNQCKPNTE